MISFLIGPIVDSQKGSKEVTFLFERLRCWKFRREGCVFTWEIEISEVLMHVESSYLGGSQVLGRRPNPDVPNFNPES